MIKIVKIIVVALTTIYLFSGCSGKLPPKNFSLHKETVQDIKQKDINIQVSM